MEPFLGTTKVCLQGSDLRCNLHALTRGQQQQATLKSNMRNVTSMSCRPFPGACHHLKAGSQKWLSIKHRQGRRVLAGQHLTDRVGRRGCVVADFQTTPEPQGEEAEGEMNGKLLQGQELLLSAQPVAVVEENKAVIVPPAGANAVPIVLPDMSGYVIKVSAELMGVFKYVEKMKRARIKELADSLWQVAAAGVLFSCVRGLVMPLMEVFSTSPPSWGKAVMMLSGIDYFAVAYLAMKAREPMLQAVGFAVEQSEGLDALEHQEEAVVTMIVELVKLFKRMRNVILVVAVSQIGQVLYRLYSINDPNFVSNLTAAARTWVLSPWT